MATNEAPAPATDAPKPASAPALSASSVTTALSVGWLLAELEAEFTHDDAERLPDGSLYTVSAPGSAALLLAQVPAARVRVRQIQAKLFLLQPDFDRAGVPPADSAALNDELAQLATVIDHTPAPDAGVATLVQEVTQNVLANLTATSSRMGRAFGLGYDLADTCRLPRSANQNDLKEAFGEPVVNIHEALADLASSLPPHAARGVSLSLAEWQYWAGNPTLSHQPVHWPQPGIVEALARQGQVWRAILSGEKRATDMLAADDYLGALKALARRLVTGRPWIWFVLFLLVLLTGVGIYLLVAAKATAAKILGIVLSAFGVVGIRTASLKQGLADVAKEIEAEVWGAEVDYAVAGAITVPPGDWRIDLKKIDTPPPRGLDPHVAANSRTVHRITHAISQHKPRPVRMWRVQEHLHDNCAYHPLTGAVEPRSGAGMKRRLRVARQLVSRPALGVGPKEINPGAPGRIVSRHPGGDNGGGSEDLIFVWTFRHARLIDLKEFKNYADAVVASRGSTASSGNGSGSN